MILSIASNTNMIRKNILSQKSVFTRN